MAVWKLRRITASRQRSAPVPTPIQLITTALNYCRTHQQLPTKLIRYKPHLRQTVRRLTVGDNRTVAVPNVTQPHQHQATLCFVCGTGSYLGTIRYLPQLLIRDPWTDCATAFVLCVQDCERAMSETAGKCAECSASKCDECVAGVRWVKLQEVALSALQKCIWVQAEFSAMNKVIYLT